MRIKCEYLALTTITFKFFQISPLWFNIPLPHINSSEWVKVEGDAIIFVVHQQVMRVAVCAASIRCRLCSATSTTCAISLPAPITVTGCPRQSQWLPWWTRFPVTGFARTSAVVLSVIHPHRWVYVYVIRCNCGQVPQVCNKPSPTLHSTSLYTLAGLWYTFSVATSLWHILTSLWHALSRFLTLRRWKCVVVYDDYYYWFCCCDIICIWASVTWRSKR